MNDDETPYEYHLRRLIHEARSRDIPLDHLGWDLWQAWVNEQGPAAAYVIDKSAVKHWWIDPRKKAMAQPVQPAETGR